MKLFFPQSFFFLLSFVMVLKTFLYPLTLPAAPLCGWVEAPNEKIYLYNKWWKHAYFRIVLRYYFCKINIFSFACKRQNFSFPTRRKKNFFKSAKVSNSLLSFFPLSYRLKLANFWIHFPCYAFVAFTQTHTLSYLSKVGCAVERG